MSVSITDYIDISIEELNQLKKQLKEGETKILYSDSKRLI